MRLSYMYLNTRYKRYEMLARSEDGVRNLCCFFSAVGIDYLLKIIGRDEIEGSSNYDYIFTVEPNIYMGNWLSHGLMDEQVIIVKDDHNIFFRTSKQGFIDLVHQWVEVRKQQPPGISIEEIKTDVWQVKSMTDQQVEHYRAIADPMTRLLPDDTAGKSKLRSSVVTENQSQKDRLMRFLCLQNGEDDLFVMFARSRDKGIGFLFCYLHERLRSTFQVDQRQFYMLTDGLFVYIGFKQNGLKPDYQVFAEDDPELLSFKDDLYYHPFKTTKQGFDNIMQELHTIIEEFPSYGFCIQEVAPDVWSVSELTGYGFTLYRAIAEPRTGFLPSSLKSGLL
ncbi:hypothetical protein HOK96_01455 [bacterium]|nr:hypothetical protein [bacterium]MBT5345701.1 hypothetical protein [bacterium]MBT6130783.1 hypothetical protein [bacterium]